jgi:hypothetical protein
MNPLHPLIALTVWLISGFGDREMAFTVAFAIVATAFSGALYVYFRPHGTFLKEIHAPAATIRQVVAEKGISADDKLNKADKAISAGALRSLWVPYRRSIRPDVEPGGPYLNLVDPYEWFGLERLPRRGYEKWATTWAGVFLTVGLFFTFVGLSAALFTVGDAGTDAVRLREAINEILKISSAKFITSIAGILAYIIWTILARACASAQTKAAGELAASIQRLSTYATPETLLYTQVKEARAQEERLKTFADDVATAFDTKMGARFDNLRPALQETIQPVVAAIEGMGSSIGQGTQAAISDLVGELISGMKGAAGSEMASIVEAMRETSAELRDAKAGIGDSGQRFNDQLVQAAEGMTLAATRMATTLEGRSAEIDDRMPRIDEVLSAGAESIGGMGANLSGALDQGLRSAIETLAHASAESARSTREQVEAALVPLVDTLRVSMDEIRRSAGDSRSELAEGGRAARAELDSAFRQVRADLAATSAEASSRVSVRRNSTQNGSASLWPTVMPSTSRRPSVLTPTAMMTATETM